ncbi:MAG: PD-(D/E)XK nuclease family protein [Pseudomonadota bacterium]
MKSQEVLAALRGGAMLITVNNRLARHWRAEFAREMARQHVLWDAPRILPWGAWLRQMWDAASWLDADAPLLLDERQSALLWQTLIEREDRPLLQARSTASLAQEAWKLMQDWRISPPFDPIECNEDVLSFQSWAQEFARQCRHGGWVDAARLPALVLEALAEGRVALPAKILFLGFDDWTPAQIALLDALRCRGTQVLVGSDAQANALNADEKPQLRCVAYPDAAQEDEAAARWARALLERDSSLRVAIVAPDLQERRARLTRLLDAQLAPSCLLPGEQDAPRPWNMSLGARLTEYGMVQASLLAFSLGDARLELAAVGRALRSPFLAGFAAEREARAELDARLRERGELSLSSSLVRKQALDHACPLFAQLMQRLEQARKSQASVQSPAQWLEALLAELKMAGWPGDGGLSSVDFQLRQSWLDALRTLAALGVVQPKMSRSAFLRQVRALAVETVFQPEAVAQAPVQVLGPLEALGLSFDAVWLLGMQHEQWPPHARPHPFLPMRLQARLHMPHASPTRELNYLRRISTRLLALAPDDATIISHPAQAEGRELEPSPLFAHLPQVTLESIERSNLPMPAEWQNQTASMQHYADESAPPLEAEAPLKGGARVLELQSACPFRAFAELRLHAAELDDPGLGPDARARGSLLHRVMELFWGEVRDQAALLAMDEETLRRCIQGHAQTAIQDEARIHRALWPERLQALEIARISALVLEWLAVERKRPPFVVEQREYAQNIEIGGLHLALKIDRIDRIDRLGGEGVEGDGVGRMLLDYKTGKATPAQWSGERPEAPQLPLYAISMQGVGALAFAQVRAGEMALNGLGDAARDGLGVSAAKEEWNDILLDYRRVLTALADDFRVGHAAVDPREPKVCTHCALSMLCRVHEKTGEGFALEVDET